jgi:hypothetical protein
LVVLGQLAFSQVRQMALLSPNTGWTQVDNHLFYTADNGKQWADITPPAFLKQRLEAAYFLRNGHGWAIASPVDSAPGVSRQRTLATTVDNGAHWVLLTFQVRGSNVPAGVSPVSLDFVDQLHGWLMLRWPSSSNFSFWCSIRYSGRRLHLGRAAGSTCFGATFLLEYQHRLARRRSKRRRPLDDTRWRQSLDQTGSRSGK